MESRYLYRGKRIDNGKWVEGSLVTGVFFRLGQEIPYMFCPNLADYDCFEDFSEENGIFEVDPSTICQCTAMPDKNKKLVFEHDIVWDSDERAFYEIIWNQEDMCWNVEDADGHKSEFEECYGNTIEVNGNRFDNPELFEVNCFQNGNS